MMKKYDTYVLDPNSLSQGKEIELTIRDLSPGPYKYQMKRVKAIVSNRAKKLSDADELWLRSLLGDLYTEPWAIRVLAELEI
jgi:hypothetical protein